MRAKRLKIGHIWILALGLSLALTATACSLLLSSQANASHYNHKQTQSTRASTSQNQSSHNNKTASAHVAQALPPADELAGVCDKSLDFGVVLLTTNNCFTSDGSGGWTTTDTFTVDNSLPIPVVPGTTATFLRPSDAHPGGAVTVSAAITIPVVNVKIKQATYTFDFPKSTPGVLVRKQVVGLDFLKIPGADKLLGFDLGAGGSLEVGQDANGTRFLVFGASIHLPSIFSATPNPDEKKVVGGLSTTVGIRIDQAGVHLDALKIELNNFYIGNVGVQQLCLSYVSAGSNVASPCAPPIFANGKPLIQCEQGSPANRWDGTAVIVLPTGGDGTRVGAFVGIRNGEFGYAGIQVTNIPAGEIPTDPFDLSSIRSLGAALCLNPAPFKFTGSAVDVVDAPKTPFKALEIQGTVAYVDSYIPTSSSAGAHASRFIAPAKTLPPKPWTLRFEGRMTIAGINELNAYLQFSGDNSISAGFKAHYNYGIATFDADVNGWVQLRGPTRIFLITFPASAAFNLDGSGKLCLNGVKVLGVKVSPCASTNITVSTVGVAGCLKVGVGIASVSAGAGVKWGQKPSVMVGSCDIGAYRAQKASISRAGVMPISVPGGATVFNVEGSTGPPKIQIKNPHGKVIFTSPAASAAINTKKFMYVENGKSTTVLLVGLARGTYTVSQVGGSGSGTTNRIIGASIAGTIKPPTTTAKVMHVHLRTYALHYRWRPDGRKVEFVEVATGQHVQSKMEDPDGKSASQVIGVAAGKPCSPHSQFDCGVIDFDASNGIAGKRDIIAVPLAVDGTSVDSEQFVVATYSAPAAVGTQPPDRVKLTRSGGKLIINWLDTQHARQTDIVIQDLTADTRVEFLHNGTPGIHEQEVIPNVPLNHKIRVTLQAIDTDPLRLSATVTVSENSGQRVAAETSLPPLFTG